MKFGDFHYALPINEPVRSYAPGSPEKAELKAKLAELKGENRDVPMVIGGCEVRTGKTKTMHPPHEFAHVLGTYHEGTADHVTQAINAALGAKAAWESLSWENRAGIFLRAAELISTTQRAEINAATMLGQSKTCYQAEIDSACELIDFLRFNVHFLLEL